MPRWERGQRVTALVVALIAVGLAVSVALGWARDMAATGAVSLGVSVFLVSWLVIQAVIFVPMGMWKELREKIKKYEETPISLLYDDADPACKRDWYRDGRLNQRLWRIGVTGPGRLLEGIVVRLENTQPSVPDLPQILHPMSSGIAQGTWQGDGTFDLRPDDTEYIDVLRYTADTGIGQTGLQLVCQQFSQSLELRSYVLTISAAAKESKRVTARFMFDVNREGLMQFYGLSDANA